MSLHVRHTDPERSPRVQIRFMREDLLYVHPGPITSPNGKITLKNGLPIVIHETGQLFQRAVGPTILDMITRQVVKDEEGKETAVWAMRDLATLWPDKPLQPRKKAKSSIKTHAVDHPFKVALASGGKVVGNDGRFVRVTKPTTISISEMAVRLAIASFGKKKLDAAQKWIGDLAAKAWRHDLERALVIWERIQKEGGEVEEDALLAQFRPGGSISQQVEEEIMREGCEILGFDPDEPLPKRGRGRPSDSAAGDKGKVIALTLKKDSDDESFVCKLIQSYHGLPQGTDLGSIDVLILIDILGKLRIDEMDRDADLLEAFINWRDPDWRERAAGSGPATATSSHDPYEVLNITPDASMEEVKKAFRRTMQRWHEDKGVGKVFAQMTNEAYRTIREQRGESK